MPRRNIESVLTELREEHHPPMVRFVTELSEQPWAAGLRYDLSMLRLWIARKNVGRLEVMVTYGDGRDGGRPSDLQLDAYDTTIFEEWVAVETVTRTSTDSIERIHQWLTDAIRRLPVSDPLRDATEEALSVSQLRDAWLTGDERACALLADRLETSALLGLATTGLAACERAVNGAPPEVAEVVRVGTAPALWSQGHRAFDQVRDLTLAAERVRPSGKDPLYLLLLVAENSARVIYNASSPSDPFDDDSSERFLRTMSELLRLLPESKRTAVLRVLHSCFTSAG